MTMTQTIALAPAAEVHAAEAERARQRRRRFQKLIKRALALAVLAGIGLVVARALMPAPVTVELGPVTRGSLQITVEETGRTRVRDRFVVSAPVTGRLARIDLRPGDRVQSGAPLARLAPLPPPLLDRRTRAELQARVAAARFIERQSHTQVAQAAHNLAQAEREENRARVLAASEAVTATELERAELALRVRRDEPASAEFGARVADEELRRARVSLGQPGAESGEAVILSSPVAGQVLRVLQESEGVVAAGAPVVEIGDPAALEVVVDVLTADAVAIRPGAKVQLDSWGGELSLSGHVRRVEPSAFTRVSALGVEEQRVNVVIDLDGPPERWAQLGDGFRVEARIVAGEVASAVLVPSGALVRSGSGWAVYHVDDRGRARLQPVTIGPRNSRAVVVQAGVTPGQTLVLYPGDRLRDGVAVRARAN
jgi:HlyD family secretion protein